MSVRRLAPAEMQPASFAFTEENERWIDGQIAKYPEGRQASAVIPMLWQAQKQHGGWLPKPAIEAVAARLEMPIIRVMEVATFYTMFNLAPAGRWFIQLCGTVPCHVKGALDLKTVLQERIGEQQHVTPDGNFSWLEVECLGACCNAPMVQINDDYYEDLTPDLLLKLLDDLEGGREVKVGPQTSRRASEPHDAVKTLQDPALFDGSVIGSWRQRFAQSEVKTPEEARAAGEVVPPPKPAETPTAPGKDVAAATAAGKADPTPGNPDSGRPEESKAADSPQQRVADGKEPVSAEARADAVNADEVTLESPGIAALSDKERKEPPKAAIGSGEEPPEGPVAEAAKPEMLSAPRDGRGDDLQSISGVGPKLEALLHRLGVFHFAQIAAWSDDNLRWVDQHLEGFKGRAGRDRWIEQARVLAAGGTKQDAEAVARAQKGTA